MITSYNTPYDRAKALVQEVVDYATALSHPLPLKRYAQVGDIVRDCEAVVVSAGSIAPGALYDPVTCVAPRSSTFLIEIIRDCAVTFNNDGTTDHDLLQTVSETAGNDGQFLYDFAAQVDGWSDKQPWSVVWSLSDAGLQVASLQITLGIS